MFFLDFCNYWEIFLIIYFYSLLAIFLYNINIDFSVNVLLNFLLITKKHIFCCSFNSISFKLYLLYRFLEQNFNIFFFHNFIANLYNIKFLLSLFIIIFRFCLLLFFLCFRSWSWHIHCLSLVSFFARILQFLINQSRFNLLSSVCITGFLVILFINIVICFWVLINFQRFFFLFISFLLVLSTLVLNYYVKTNFFKF